MMKKLFLICGILLASMTAMADGEQKIDVKTVTKITFEGDKVIVHYNNGTTDTAFDMAEITIDLSTVTSIEERLTITREAGLEGQSVFNLQGQMVGKSAANLSKGIYIINGKKVIIK